MLPRLRFLIPGVAFALGVSIAATEAARCSTSRASAAIISVDNVSGAQRVYNLEIQRSHSYLVGRQHVLVHNQCVTPASIMRAAQQSPYRTMQSKIEVAKVQEFVNMLNSGQSVDPIKVSGDFLVDGHHRHLASLITGKYVPVIQVPMPATLEPFMGLTDAPLAEKSLNIVPGK